MLYSITLGLITKKGRQAISFILNHSGLRFLNMSCYPNLPTISVNSVIGDEQIVVLEPKSKDGNVSLDELVIINGIIKRVHPKYIFEIGTFNGRTTLNMAYNSPEDCKVFTLDLPNNNADKMLLKLTDYDKLLINQSDRGERVLKSDYQFKTKIIQLYGDSASYDFQCYYNSIDIVFVDGAHSYDYALKDSYTALKLLKNNTGVIIWHDYEEGVEVVKAIDAVIRKMPDLKFFHIEGTSLAFCERN
ncbi:MAG: class I SAM-dependent methyltransferase [Candidatus Omnitrophota bacterium]|nr:class I SAM-dependent methyltransferase [Candidatus Omnitrophota bacterium]